MSIIDPTTSSADIQIQSILSASDTYIETLTIKSIAAQPWLIELVIKTQFLTAKNPDEERIKARCCVERAQLVGLGEVISQFLKETGSSTELDES
jgi:hypothetical protein